MLRVEARELRRDLSRFLERVKAGESLEITEQDEVVARLSPAGERVPRAYAAIVAERGATVPTGDLVEMAKGRARRETPAGTTDALLTDGRANRA